MSYLVLARKWRPQVFEDVIGQRHVTQTLQNAISSKRVAHAYLFSGSRGVGKTTVARILAKALNCVKGPAPVPCNECEVCADITASSSIDVLEIDGASNTGVENIRELRETIKYLPSKGRYRIYIIDEVHMLSNSAFNALLKTLEEPPAHAVFIFATTEPHKIPDTILSRCQRFDFKRISLKDIQNQIKHIASSEGIEINDTAVYLLARESEGSMRDSQGLLDQVVSFSGNKVAERDIIDALGIMDRQFLFRLTDAIIRKDDTACLNLIENIYNFGYDFKRFCQDLLEQIRNLIVVKTVKESKDLLDIPDAEVAELQKLAEEVSLSDVQIMLNILYRSYEEIARSAMPRFVLEMAILRMTHIDKFQSIDEMIKRLEGVEGGAGERDFEAVKRGADFSGSVHGSIPAAAVAADGDLWHKLLVFVRGKKPALASHLEYAVPVAINQEVVSVKVKDGHYFTYLTNNKESFMKLCEEFFRKKITVDIESDMDINTVSNGKAAVQDDPVIKDALRIFGGRII